MQKKEELLENLTEMMSEAHNQSELYLPGNFWKTYEKNILKEIKNNDISKFRSWPGGTGTGSIHSFGGGEKDLTRVFGRNFHPFDIKYLKIDNNFFVEKYNSLINKLINFIPFFSFFTIRSAEARKYFFSRTKLYQETLYELIFNLDKELLQISDSNFGNPLGIYKNDKFYTTEFLNKLRYINTIKKNTDLNKIETVVELGAGIGLLASCFLKLKKNIKYIIIDIPPTILFSEYYLRNLGYKVFGHKELKENKDMSLSEILKDFQVCVLPSWKLDLLKDYKCDLFINIESFQEMEKEQSLNYINIIKNSISNYIYLRNNIDGHHKARKSGDFGVLNPTNKSDIENHLLKTFKIKYSQSKNNFYETLFEKK